MLSRDLAPNIQEAINIRLIIIDMRADTDPPKPGCNMRAGSGELLH
jgi:hypothetical protein